jgi:hypothetical protein
LVKNNTKAEVIQGYFTLGLPGYIFGVSPGVSPREDCMGEHIMHKKESKKAPQKTLKEKRKEKKNKDKSSAAGSANS